MKFMRYNSIMIFSLSIPLLFSCATSERSNAPSEFANSKDIVVAKHVSEALLNMKESRYIQAIAGFLQAQSIAPDSRPIKENLAVALMQAGFYEEAQPVYQSLHLAAPQQSSFIFALGDIHFGQNNYAAALDLYEYAVAVEKEKTKLEVNDKIRKYNIRISQTAFLLGLDQKAYCAAHAAYIPVTNEDNALPYLEVLIRLGRYNEAKAIFDMLGVQYKNPRLYLILAVVSYNLNDQVKFKQAAAKVYEHNNLEVLNDESGQPIVEIDKVMELIEGE